METLRELNHHPVMAWTIFGLMLVSIAMMGLLCYVYYRRKEKYYHDLTHKTKPTHIRYQMYMVFCALAAFVFLCAMLAIMMPTDWLAWFAGIGVLLTWICQDMVQNIVAYVVLIRNGMLHLGDWIILDQYGLDGKVTDISLTSVIVENWDGSQTSISTKSLLDTKVQNLQHVLDKKTAGRRMQRNFLLDVQSVHDLTDEQLVQLREVVGKRDGDDSVIDYAIAKGERLNLRLYRLYLRHWLMNQDTVTRSPHFAIRLLDQTAEGLPMQVYAFLLPTQWEEYEQEQARIVEHIVGTIGLFGLVLYQQPAGTDTNNVYLVKGE